MDKKQTGFFTLSPEAKVGLFVLIGIMLLVYMSLKVGGFRLGKAEGYTLYATFDSAAGLDINASVKVAGVEVGRVKKITLTGNKARLELLINRDVKIGRDFTAALKSTGLLGEKYLELIPGAPGSPPLKDGQEITRTAKYMDIDRLLTSLSDLSTDLRKISESLGNVLGGPEGQRTIKDIVGNIREMTGNVNALIKKNDEKIDTIVANIETFSRVLGKDGPRIAKALEEAVNNLNTSLVETSRSLNGLIEENRANLREGVANLKTAAVKLERAMETLNRVTGEVAPDVKKTIESMGRVAEKIDRGEGTIGKLVNDREMAESLGKTVKGINSFLEQAQKIHVYLGYRGEYLFAEDDVKGYLTFRVQPRSDKYYLFEVVDDPRGKVTTKTESTIVNGTKVTTTQTTITDKLKFSAEIAKGFGPVTLRGGLIESEGGVGIDYEPWKNRLRFTFEAFDFNQTGNPHLKVGARFNINKYFYFTAGADDFISRIGLATAYLGLGLEFRDDDIKYLLSNAPPVSFQ